MSELVEAHECGHLVKTFPFMASRSDGVISRIICLPLLCESCRIMREVHGIEVPKGSRVLRYEPISDYSAQKPDWAAKLRRLDDVANERAQSDIVLAWPESYADVIRGFKDPN